MHAFALLASRGISLPDSIEAHASFPGPLVGPIASVWNTAQDPTISSGSHRILLEAIVKAQVNHDKQWSQERLASILYICLRHFVCVVDKEMPGSVAGTMWTSDHQVLSSIPLNAKNRVLATTLDLFRLTYLTGFLYYLRRVWRRGP